VQACKSAPAAGEAEEATMAEPAREGWGSNAGFILATLGSAVGLGNVWRFSYVAGENGGGAFLAVYVATVFAVGVPLLLGELAIGRAAQREGAAAFRALAPGSPWRHLGMLGVVLAGLILSYYAVIAGWVLRYLWLYLSGASASLAESGFAAGFESFTAHPIAPVAWQMGFMLLTTLVVAVGVKRGIEGLSRWLMPALAVLLLGLAVHSAFLPGFQRGVAFLLHPDWSALARPGIYVAAVGQAFFSIGLAMGVMVTYGSYLGPQRRLPAATVVIALGDTLFAVTAGLVVFPAVFSFGLDPAQGPALAFVVLPEVFSKMTGGGWVGAAFFVLLAIAALTSAVSLLEVTVAYAMQRFGWSRAPASAALGTLFFGLGAPAALGYGPWAGVQGPGGRNILDLLDFVAANVLLPVNGLLIAVFLGWVWQRRAALSACDLHAPRLGQAWCFGMRYLVPVLVAAVLARSLWSA
jgi:NSS family neurotransmitter:Na+ symporter